MHRRKSIVSLNSDFKVKASKDKRKLLNKMQVLETAKPIMEKAHRELRWKIPNFTKEFVAGFQSGTEIKSNVFSVVLGSNRMKFLIVLYPRGEKELFKDYISVYVRVLSKTSSNFRYDGKVSIVDSTDKIESEFSYSVESKSIAEGGGGWGFGKLINRGLLFSPTKSLLPGNILTLDIKIDFEQTEAVPDKSPASVVSNSFESLINSEPYHDFKFLTSCGKTVFAHKCILANRCPQLSATIKDKTEMKVAANEQAVLEFLRFIYCGEIQGLDKVASDLLAVAHAFKMPELKKMCSEELSKYLTVSNVVKIVSSVYHSGSEEVVNLCVSFIAQNYFLVAATAEWESLKNVDLLKDITAALISNIRL